MPSLLSHRFVLLLALACTACGTLLDGPPTNICASDSDCGSGTCDLEREICVTAAPSTPLSIALEVQPATDPLGVTPLPVTFEPREVGGPTELGDVTMRLSVSVHGTVANALAEPISAALTFTEISPIPGGPATRIETQTFPTMREGTEEFNYATQLLPGRPYTLTIEPNGEWRELLPPLYLADFPVLEPGTRLNQPIPYPETVEVRGSIVDGAGLEQSGMVVRAVEPTSGRVISSTYITGNDPSASPGHFVLHLLPSSEAWFFTITPSSDRVADGGPSPTFSVDPLGLLEVGGEVTILMPDISNVVTYSGWVERMDPPGEPARGATLVLTSNDVVDASTGVVGTYRTMATTGNDGAFEAQLLPGTYEVVITPSEPELAVLRHEGVHIDPLDRGFVMGQLFQLPPRRVWGGWIQTASGERMFDARARGVARATTLDQMLDPAALFARSSETLSDADGFFRLALDYGLYDVIVEPPAGTSWPWWISRDVRIDASGETDAVLSNNVELRAPIPLSGRLVFEAGPAVASGEVRAYAIVEADGAVRSIQVARAQTDADGRFTLLLPPSL